MAETKSSRLDEFQPGDHVSWKYGVGKATGRIVSKVTEDTKLGGRTFRATPDDPKYRLLADKTKREVVRRGQVLSRVEEASHEAAEEEPDHSEESEEGHEMETEKAPEAEAHEEEPAPAHQGNDKKDEVQERSQEEASGTAATGTRCEPQGAVEPKATIKSALITGTGGDSALPSEEDDIDLSKHSVTHGQEQEGREEENLTEAAMHESTVDRVAMEDESAWQLGNHPQNAPGEEHHGIEAGAGEGGGGETDVRDPGSGKDEASVTPPHTLPHQEVTQPGQFTFVEYQQQFER